MTKQLRNYELSLFSYGIFKYQQDSGFQETLEDISKKGEQGTYKDGEQVIVTDKECQPKVNTTKKSKKKITQV